MRITSTEDGDAKSYISPFLELHQPRREENVDSHKLSRSEKI